METFAIVTYVISSKILEILEISEDHQAQMTNAEIMTFAIVAEKFFHCNFKMARYMCLRCRLFSHLSSNSRLNRRVHNIPWACWHATFGFLALIFQRTTNRPYYAVDSFPVACCQKNRIDKRKLFIERRYLGYAASKRGWVSDQSLLLDSRL